ncbi:MAG: galactose mutarotase [Pseudomonadota bacterium]
MAALTLFGTLADGRGVQALKIRFGPYSAELLDYGARLVGFWKSGGPNACVESRDLDDYEGPLAYAGPVIAPVINRIGGAAAEIGGNWAAFEANQDGRQSLHSGQAGTYRKVWELVEQDECAITLAVDLPHGEGGFPGNRRIEARYALGEDGLELGLRVTTDRITILNPGHHGLWAPGGSAPPSSFQLTVPAARFLPVTAETLPTGEIADVGGTVYDHRAPRSPDPSLDHNYCFEPGFGLRARLEGREGDILEVYSDAPGLQAFAGGQAGVALEPQLWPDAPNHPKFPSIVLEPGQVFEQQSLFKLLP